MKLKFIGDPNDNFKGAYGRDGAEDKTITKFGVKFKKGEAVEVSKEIYAKLKDNSHFEIVKTRKRKADGNAS